MPKILGLIVTCVVIGTLITGYFAQRKVSEAELNFPALGQFVEIDDRRVHAVVKGQGPNIVLIHGASGNLRDFTFELVDRLAQTYRVIAFDRPGFGWSDPPETNAEGITAQAITLQRAAESLGARKPLVLGHSYGGSVALAWAIERPENIAGLVALGAASNTWPEAPSTFYRTVGAPLIGRAVAALLPAFASDARVDRAIAGVFAPQLVPEGYNSYFGVGLSLRPRTQALNARQRLSLKSELRLQIPKYGRINVPVEILHGAADITVPPHNHAQPLARRIRDAGLTLLDGVGHMPHHAEPQAVQDVVDQLAVRAGLR